MVMIGLSAEWQHPTILLLTTINLLLGQPQRAEPKRELEAADLIKIAEELIKKQYDPASWFNVSTAPPGAAPAIPSRAESPNEAATYLLPNLQGSNPANAMLSVAEGGVLYEDPFWFLLAAYEVGRSGRLPILPKGTPQAVWTRRAELLEELRAGTLVPDRWFTRMDPVGEGNGLPARIRTTTGAEILKMRLAGDALLTDPGSFPKVYSLYGYSP
jgi:hypothetical protein